MGLFIYTICLKTVLNIESNSGKYSSLIRYQKLLMEKINQREQDFHSKIIQINSIQMKKHQIKKKNMFISFHLGNIHLFQMKKHQTKKTSKFISFHLGNIHLCQLTKHQTKKRIIFIIFIFYFAWNSDCRLF